MAAKVFSINPVVDVTSKWAFEMCSNIVDGVSISELMLFVSRCIRYLADGRSEEADVLNPQGLTHWPGIGSARV
jgi:hypothetical protein